MNAKLKQIARTINELAKQEEDAHLALCRTVAAAQDLVKKESNLSWREWADQYLRQPDGSKWSLWTLYKYASYGRNPEKLANAREAINRHGINARRALRTTTELRPSGRSIDLQVEALMFAWRGASPEARKLFLEKVAGNQMEAA